MEKLDLLIRDGEVWTPGGFVEADIAVHQGKVVALGKPPVLPESADTVIEAKGKKVIPGLVDTHTHHRDPGFTHKEDLTYALFLHYASFLISLLIILRNGTA